MKNSAAYYVGNVWMMNLANKDFKYNLSPRTTLQNLLSTIRRLNNIIFRHVAFYNCVHDVFCDFRQYLTNNTFLGIHYG